MLSGSIQREDCTCRTIHHDSQVGHCFHHSVFTIKKCNTTHLGIYGRFMSTRVVIKPVTYGLRVYILQKGRLFILYDIFFCECGTRQTMSILPRKSCLVVWAPLCSMGRGHHQALYA